MALTALTGIPCSWESGDTLIFSETFADYPTADWSAVLYLSLNGGTPTAISATEVSGAFVFTLSAAATAALAPGTYDYAIRVTNGSAETAKAKAGRIAFTPNPATAQTPSTAQTMVTRLETVLQTFATTDRISVSMNGQSFTRANMKDYQSQWTFWKARVIAEQRAAARARGECIGDNYVPRFGGGNSNPFPCGCR
jgi:hypothetical protein